MKRSTVPTPIHMSAGAAAGLRPDHEKSTPRRPRASRDAMAALAHRDFRHEALFYASRDEFLERTLDFLQAGIEADDPTLVVLNATRATRCARSSVRAHATSPGRT
jgi:hypothetical protein